jgi:hypothetical protein
MGLKKELVTVKALAPFGAYRNKVLGLPLKSFRALQLGEVVEIARPIYEQYLYLFEEIKDGD